MKIKTNRKGQEEITGFVLIMAIVAIVLLIVLSLFLRKGGSFEKNSVDVSQFLESAMEFSTNCESYREVKLGDLIKECYDNPSRICDSGESRCELLNRTLNDMLKESWDVGENKFYKGFLFISELNRTESEKIVEIQKGTCEGSYREGEYFSYYSSGELSGSIVNTLRVCY